MYNLVGDFIRMGPSMNDPYHSLCVTNPSKCVEDGRIQEGTILHSINRGHGRRLTLHTWRTINHGGCPKVEPIHSERLSPMVDFYHKVEKERGSL